MSTTLPIHEPGGDDADPAVGEADRVSQNLAGALDRRLATCPSVRPDAVADARARLASGHPPSGDEVADALVHRIVAERLT